MTGFYRITPSRIEELYNSLTIREITLDSQDSQRTVNFSQLLKKYVRNDYVDADAVARELFPALGTYDYFISHASAHKEEADKLKQYLTARKSAKVFVDGDIWGNVYDALKAYQFFNRQQSIDINEANKKAAHLYMMLTGALTEVMKRSANFIWITSSATVIDGQLKTSSPWILHELNTAKLIHDLQGDLVKASHMRMVNESAADLPLYYGIDTGFLKPFRA